MEITMKRNEILNIIYKNGRLKHFAANKKWYIKNDVLYVYNAILKKTSFLDIYKCVTLRERIFYIENNMNGVVKCNYCDNKLKYCKNIVELSKTCGAQNCRKSHQSIISNKMWKNFDNDKLDMRNKKISKKLTGRKLSDKTIKKIKIANIGRVQSDDEKNKRITTRLNNGKEWHTLETIEKIKQSNIITHNSKEFKEKYKKTYEMAHKKISNTMKEKILMGEFTPCITNSWTNWRTYVEMNGIVKKFRSNWDAAFWILNKNLKYENIRIKYEIDGEWHSYIVDFSDTDGKKLYEVKPKSLAKNRVNEIKFTAAKIWCGENGYTFDIIDDDWFNENAKYINYDTHPQLLKSMKQFL